MVLERYRSCIETNALDVFAGLYAEDAVIDANVPAWRYQLQGRDQIGSQFHVWYGAPHELLEWREQPTAHGAVVETVESFLPGTSRETYARSLHVFDVRDGLIARHTFYCTGPWDQATVARHRETAPMVTA